jgi:hypothetical protein
LGEIQGAEALQLLREAARRPELEALAKQWLEVREKK